MSGFQDDGNKTPRQLLHELGIAIENLESTYDSRTIENAQKAINEFEAEPELLDANLEHYIKKLTQLYMKHKTEINDHSNELKKCIGSLTYSLAKVRGFKFITNFFNSDVYMVLPLIDNLKGNSHDEMNENEIFFSLLWLNNLVIVPFNFLESMINDFLCISIDNLTKFSNGSKNQKISLILLARLLGRNDSVLLGYLDSYITDITLKWSGFEPSTQLGHLMVLNKLFKICTTKSLLPHLHSITSNIVQFQLVNLRSGNINNLNLLFIIKILGRLGDQFMIIKDYFQLQEIIDNLVNGIVNYLHETLEINLRYAIAKSLSKLCGNLGLHAINYQHQLTIYLINQLDLPLTIPTVTDYRTPNVSMFQSINIDFDTISIAKYHTVLLFLGYLALNRTLPVHMIPVVLSIVHETLFTTQRIFNLNLGNQLKDSSCFIVWSLLRMIKNDQYQLLQKSNPNMFNQIFVDLIEVTIFDKDLIIRRCGVAVIQEFVGRFGKFIFKVDDDFAKGEKIIRFVELFSIHSITLIDNAFNIFNQLLDFGVDKNLILTLLLKNLIKQNDDFKYQKVISKKLNEIFNYENKKDLDLGIYYDEIDYEYIMKAMNDLDHNVYLKSEVLLFSNKIPTEDILLIDQYDEEYEEDYLKYLECCCKYNIQQEKLQQLLQPLIVSKRDISTGLSNLFTLMTRFQYEIDDTLFKTMIRSMNISLSKSIFYYRWRLDRMEVIIQFIHSEADFELRSNLINNLHENFNQDISQETLNGMILLLNDYTTTEQGDVGSKIRNAMLDFITDNLSHFDNKALIPHLLRLSGESISKLRHKAFNILAKVFVIDIGTIINEEMYYDELFKFYHQYILHTSNSAEFWKGITFSIGGLTGDRENLNQSFKAVLKYLESLKEPDYRQIFKELILLLTKQKKDLIKSTKEYLVCLNTIIKLLEASIEIPSDYIKFLFVKIYNLQINTTNVIRIKLTVKLLQYLALQNQDPETAKSSLKRLSQLLTTHKMTTIKFYVLEVIYDMLIEFNDSYYKQLEIIDIMQLNELDTVAKYLLNRYIEA